MPLAPRVGGRKQLRNLFGWIGTGLNEDKDHLQPHFQQGGGNLARAAAQAYISHALDAGFSNQWHPHG